MPILSQSDVKRLLAEPSTEARAAIAEKLGQAIDNPQIGPAELAIAHDIVRILAKDIAEAVRASVAHSLRGSDRLPHDVALCLASDIERVALPVLSCSEVLTPQELIGFVRLGSTAKQTAIAARRNLPEEVSDEIICVAHASAVTTLLRNATARIAETSLGKAIDRFADDDNVKECIVRRETLPAAIAERLVGMVADHLQTYLVTHHEMQAGIATDIVTQIRDFAAVKLSQDCSEDELERLVRNMHDKQRLTPSLVLRALCLGDIAFFEMAMATLADVPVLNARRLIHDAGPNGLRSLFAKSGLPEHFLPAIRVAVDIVRCTEHGYGEHDLERYRARIITGTLTQSEEVGEDDLNYLLDKLTGVLHRVQVAGP